MAAGRSLGNVFAAVIGAVCIGSLVFDGETRRLTPAAPFIPPVVQVFEAVPSQVNPLLD